MVKKTTIKQAGNWWQSSLGTCPSASVLTMLEKSGIKDLVNQRVSEQIQTPPPPPHLSPLILGLDVSSSRTGFVILSTKSSSDSSSSLGSVIDWGVIDTTSATNYKDLVDIATEIDQTLATQTSRFSHHCEWKIGIEDYMRTFFTGKFNTKGIMTLAQLNGMVTFNCAKLLDTKPYHIHPSTARTYLSLSKSSSNIKEAVMKFATSHARGPESRQFVTELQHDVADAYVMAWYTFVRDWIATCILNNDHYCTVKSSFHTLYSQKNAKRLDTKFNSSKILTKRYVDSVYENAVVHYVKNNSDSIFRETL